MKNIKVLENVEFKSFVINNYISPSNCKKIIKELNKFNEFDDTVMGGRHRINKGSKNFKKFLNSSKNSKAFFDSINNVNYFKSLFKIFKKINGLYSNKVHNNYEFSKKVYGAQSGTLITGKKTNRKKNLVYLDLDFSVSDKGYSRGPHRDRDSRVFNFLIYLNTLSKKDGAILNLFNIKKKTNFKEARFPSRKELKKVESIKVTAGTAVFFESTPNSYHSVSNFYAITNKKRYFIYGSYSQNKKVIWSKF